MARLLLNSKHYAGKRIQGEREYQEDDFIFDHSKPGHFLMVLADGMGGHHGGAQASQCAVQAFNEGYRTSWSNPTGRSKTEGYRPPRRNIARQLRDALYYANQQIALEAHSKPELYGMGCTLVGVAIDDYQLEWVSVGDSPLWLYSGGELRRLNADHSMKPFLDEQVRRGHLTPEQVAVHPERNILFSALMGNHIDMIDQSCIKLIPGDCVLLASDGLLTLSNHEICEILQKKLTPKEWTNELLQRVQNKGKWDQDNTTVLIVKIPSNNESPKKIQKNKTLGLSITTLIIFLALLSIQLSLCHKEEKLSKKQTEFSQRNENKQ